MFAALIIPKTIKIIPAPWIEVGVSPSRGIAIKVVNTGTSGLNRAVSCAPKH